MEWSTTSCPERNSLNLLRTALEHAEYNGNLYGSPRPAALKNVVVLEPQGYAHLKKMYPQTLGVFIYLPEDVIVQRLSGRKDTSPEVIAERMAGDKEVFADIQEKVDFVLDGRMPIKEAVEVIIRMLNLRTEHSL